MSEIKIHYKGVPLTVDYEYDAPEAPSRDREYPGCEEAYGINQILAGEVDITPVFNHDQIYEIIQLLKSN